VSVEMLSGRRKKDYDAETHGEEPASTGESEPADGADAAEETADDGVEAGEPLVLA
jgi:hypothetical protein